MSLRRRLAILLATVAPLLALCGPATAAPRARASLTDIENDVMCVSCRESLAVAQSPQAQFERSYIRMLIGQGLDKAQIEKQLVAQYGPSVLGRPPAHGFNLTVYVLPPAILVIGLAALAIVLPRWRRRSRGGVGAVRTPALAPADAHRLDEELARFKG
jgi:cytochrome c-type biogenesis protein CcmH